MQKKKEEEEQKFYLIISNNYIRLIRISVKYISQGLPITSSFVYKIIFPSKLNAQQRHGVSS
jgi:hypothetical protein